MYCLVSEKYLNEKKSDRSTKDIMHTGTVTIAVVSMYNVHQKFTTHVDKFAVYNSVSILFNILSIS